MTSTEMAIMSGVGAFFSFGIVYSLATNDVFGNGEVNGGEEVLEHLGKATGNVLDVMLPSTATDFISITLGEALAGVIGAASTFLLSAVVSRNNSMRSAPAKDAVADGDFFVANAAAFPLVQSLGMSPLVSSIVTSVFASIPYELVKYGSRQRDQRIQEDKLLQQLLQERDRKKTNTRSFSLFTWVTPDSGLLESSNRLVPIDNQLDVVEIFSDLIRWLEYGILMTDFGGKLSLVPGVESAVYGVLATISSQVYGDLLYGVFGFGGELKRDRVRDRTASDWSTFYLSRALYAATLFGVYDAAQIPAKRVLNMLLSGSYAACQGSVDYNLCTESFLYNNPPPSPSFAAQFRALCTTFYSLWNQLGFHSFP
ncbi:hypothetical protein MPSEU_000425000 [Mayamaea pseudoterrestris]|nr:hypothetical protein MPSEU_000425000 [Mayamaea pseudoterrestris]